jgi:hypothetical protein
MSSHAWPHSEIKEIFLNIFMVMGTNITRFNNVDLQHSRNMIIIRENNKLSLINTVRLTDTGLAALDALGQVENVIRIGAFHGRDDVFYLERYQAKLWGLKGMRHDDKRLADVELAAGGQMPFSDAALFVFQTAIHPEGILHIAREGGILITCDSIKNWIIPDEFFSKETAKLYQQQGFFGTASISNVWKQACKVQVEDFMRLKTLGFKHLLSAHGDPLLNNAYNAVNDSIAVEFET